MANHKTGSQRYNDRMDKIFAKSKELNEKYHGKDSFGSKKEVIAKKMSQSKNIKSIMSEEKKSSHY